jgi:hypothetical protein
MEKYQVLLDLTSEMKSVRYQLFTELVFGIINTKIGDDDRAHRHLQQSLDVPRCSNQNELIVASLSRLSDWYTRRGEWDAGESAINEAERLMLSMDAKDQLRKLWRARATIALASGQNDRACEPSEKTIALCRDLELQIDKGMAWRILGRPLRSAASSIKSRMPLRAGAS